MSSLGDAINRALQKRKEEQDAMDSQKSPDQLAADKEAKLATYKQAKEKLGYSTPNE